MYNIYTLHLVAPHHRLLFLSLHLSITSRSSFMHWIMCSSFPAPSPFLFSPSSPCHLVSSMHPPPPNLSCVPSGQVSLIRSVSCLLEGPEFELQTPLLFIAISGPISRHFTTSGGLCILHYLWKEAGVVSRWLGGGWGDYMESHSFCLTTKAHAHTLTHTYVFQHKTTEQSSKQKGVSRVAVVW